MEIEGGKQAVVPDRMRVHTYIGEFDFDHVAVVD